jgi:hypothetical protein
MFRDLSIRHVARFRQRRGYRQYRPQQNVLDHRHAQHQPRESRMQDLKVVQNF